MRGDRLARKPAELESIEPVSPVRRPPPAPAPGRRKKPPERPAPGSPGPGQRPRKRPTPTHKPGQQSDKPRARKTPPPNRQTSKRAKQNRRINAPLVASVVIVFLFASLYIANAIGQAMAQTDIPTIAPAFGDVAPPQVHRGLIVRDEAVYHSQRDGVVVFHQLEGTRVRPGALVAEIQEGSYLEELSESLGQLEGEILQLQARRGVWDTEMDHINSQLGNVVAAHLPRLDSDFGAVYSLTESARGIIGQRSQLMLSDDISVRGLVEQREQLQARLGGSIQRMYAQGGGILSYSSDGLEDLLTFDNMRDLLPEQVRQSTSPSPGPRNVLAGEPVFRIIRSNDWYIAMHLPIGAVGGWNTGQVRTIYLEWQDDWREVEVVIEELRPYIDTAFVLFEATRFMADFADHRDIAVRLSTATSDHIQVPVEVVRTMDAVRIPLEYVSRPDTATPSVVREGIGENPAQYLSLDIFRRSGDFVYMLTDSNDLRSGDIVRHPEGGTHPPFFIAEITPIHGVFLLRFGFADFVDLHIGDTPGYTEGYIVLEASANPRITSASRIIQNPAGLQDGQRLLRE